MNLTPAQLERYAILAEELGEVQQRVGKILRHGTVTELHNNRVGLEHELGDLQWAIGLLVRYDDVWQSSIDRFAQEKPAKAQPHLHFIPGLKGRGRWLNLKSDR